MHFRFRPVILLLIGLSACQVSVAQQASGDAEKAREEICKRVSCRPPTTVRLRLNDKEYVELEFPKSPYVADGFINVLAGEELNVEFDESNGQLSNPGYVKTSTKPERTVSFRLEQSNDGMILTVKNQFAKDIVYDCLIQHYKEQRFQKTSTIPVRGGLISFEGWAFPIAQVAISNVRFTSTK